MKRKAAKVAKWSGHAELYESVKRSIHVLFSDTSVSRDKTRESLKGLRDEIDTLLGSLSVHKGIEIRKSIGWRS